MLIDYLPDHLKEIHEMRQITEVAEQPEFDFLLPQNDKAINNQFLETADEYGLARREKIFNISPKASATLEERRFTLSTHILEYRPTTMLFLKKQLDNICGKKGYTLLMKDNVLIVKLALATKSAITAVHAAITKIRPANIALDLDLLYNKQSGIAKYRHSELKAYEHETIRAEVLP